MVETSPSATLSTFDGSSTSSSPFPRDFLSSKPIADFFPHTTVLFADIVGFTSWSSVRDPTQVFQLLETLYNAFDTIAKRRKVFKVETIGDCYVAVTGLPEPMDEHALAMAKFAKQCMVKMMTIVQALCIHLGPDTGELSMRFGLHSGSVTAGVMRGEKSRFQLFGDTVNTAARIESTGERGKIHLSQDTADLIIAAGKGNWVKPREIKVNAKGEGKLQTYWLEITSGKSTNTNDSSSVNLLGESVSDDGDLGESVASIGVGHLVAKFEKVEEVNSMGEQKRRQADYAVEVLLRSLKRIIAKRGEIRAIPGAAVSDEFNKLEIEQAKASIIGELMDEIAFQRTSTHCSRDCCATARFCHHNCCHVSRQPISQF
jgi:class 3 adenylate cyclase